MFARNKHLNIKLKKIKSFSTLYNTTILVNDFYSVDEFLNNNFIFICWRIIFNVIFLVLVRLDFIYYFLWCRDVFLHLLIYVDLIEIKLIFIFIITLFESIHKYKGSEGCHVKSS